MTRARVQLEPGYVLNARPYSDTSLLVELFTRGHGRVGLVAKGARGPKSKTRALLQPLTADAGAELAAGRIDLVLHYSRRSARQFLAAATEAGLLPQALHPVHHCLAEPVAAVLREAGANTVEVAAQPDEKHLLSLLA